LKSSDTLLEEIQKFESKQKNKNKVFATIEGEQTLFGEHNQAIYLDV
jgi:hypothetical protein